MPDDSSPPPPPVPPEPEIHRAARLGDTASVERLVASGVPIDARCDLEFDHGPFLRGLTPLMVAARSVDGADVETLRWLLAHGADLRAVSEAGVTAAWYAAGKGGRWGTIAWHVGAPHVERLRVLLDAGLDARASDWNGRSLVVEACDAGDPARVALLLERGASATPAWSAGDADRHRESARSGWEDAVSAMLRTQGDAPPVLDRALLVDLLMSQTGSGPPSYGVPMFAAAKSGSAECVDLLLCAGASPDLRDEEGQTPLLCAGSAAVVRRLVSAGADPLAQTPGGDDGIDCAIVVPGGDGEMPPSGREVADALVECGVPLAREGRRGYSRLALAAFRRGAEAVNWLLSRGVVPQPDSSDHRRPLHAICWQGEMPGADANAACERIVRALVAAGDDVEARDDSGRTPLLEAAGGDWGNPTAVRVLLELGARPDEPDHGGTTPLMEAASLGEVECVRLLLEAGADPSLRDGDGRSALDRAREHHATWVRLAGDASSAPPGHGRETLRDAIATLRLLDEAVAARGGA